MPFSNGQFLKCDILPVSNDPVFIKEPSEEGGTSTLNKVGKPCHLPATILERLAIPKRSAEKEEASRLQQAKNSQTTLSCLSAPDRSVSRVGTAEVLD